MKKILSVFLVIVMMFTITVPAFAAEDASGAESYDGNPVIIVRGIDFAGLTYADGTKALDFSAGSIFSILVDAFFASLKLTDAEAVTDGLFVLANEIFSPIACDKEGNSVENVSMVQYPGSMAEHPEFTEALTDGGEIGIVKTAIERYGAENVYFFTYDWRKTPQQIADELKGFVDRAKQDTGKDKVNIICASMGGMVTTAYMYYHGTDSIESAVYLSGAQNGTYVCGDALNGRIVLEKKVVLSFLNDAIGGNVFLKVIVALFDGLGAVNYITNVANDIVTNSFDRANDLMLRDCFGTLCGFWALCPDEDFDSGVNTIFGGLEEEYPVLIEKINETREFVFSTEETLLNAKRSGVKISFVSNYNKPLIPVYERANANGDAVLETELTSNFATVAPLGETLSAEYLENADKTYVSPDKVIDASTAVFKENTWFVKNAPHVAADYGTEFSDFTFALLECEVQPDVNTFEEYPRFMYANDALELSAMR